MRAFKGYMGDYEIVYKQDRTFFKVKLYSKEQNNFCPEVTLASIWQLVSFSFLDKYIFSFWHHSVRRHLHTFMTDTIRIDFCSFFGVYGGHFSQKSKIASFQILSFPEALSSFPLNIELINSL